ncbi:hypothetical protein [Thomasclavelia cocleata]|uniref:hypothetical protein n=1 Tax=Thomasclavelia cocleata TaxID=69824 RepID=UPI00258FD0AE|nr:hypothetical protein [Thomasclavelia cocleata]
MPRAIRLRHKSNFIYKIIDKLPLSKKNAKYLSQLIFKVESFFTNTMICELYLGPINDFIDMFINNRRCNLKEFYEKINDWQYDNNSIIFKYHSNFSNETGLVVYLRPNKRTTEGDYITFSISTYAGIINFWIYIDPEDNTYCLYYETVLPVDKALILPPYLRPNDTDNPKTISEDNEQQYNFIKYKPDTDEYEFSYKKF